MANLSVPPGNNQVGVSAEGATEVAVSASETEDATVAALAPSKMVVVAMKGDVGADGGAKNLSELKDVDITTNPPTNNQPLVYNDYFEKWVPGLQPLNFETLGITTESLDPGGVEDVSLQSPQFFNITTVFSENPVWIRVYGTSEAREADTRTSPGGIPPAAGTGFYAEVVTTESTQFIEFSPIPAVNCTGTVFIRAVNMDSVAREIDCYLGILAYGVYYPGS